MRGMMLVLADKSGADAFKNPTKTKLPSL